MSAAYSRYEARVTLTPAKGGYVGVRLYAPDKVYWDALLADFKALLPTSARRFDGTLRVWLVSLDYSERLEMWVYATFEEAAIDDERPRWRSSNSSGHQREESPPKARQPLSTLSAAYRTLHVCDDAPLSVVEASYRALAKATHPDHDGSHEAQKAINSAVALIRDAQARKSKTV